MSEAFSHPDVVVYRFEDGWEIRRVLDAQAYRKLTATLRDPESRGLFGLYDARGRAQSCLGFEHASFIPAYLRPEVNSVSPLGIKEAFHEDVERYWIEFIGMTLGPEHLSGVVRDILVYSSELDQRLKDPSVEEPIRRAIAQIDEQYRRPDRESMAIPRAISALEHTARRIVESVFQNMRPFEVLEPPHPGQFHYANIRLPDIDHLLLITAGEAGWLIRSGDQFQHGLATEGVNSLWELWNHVRSVISKEEIIDLVPEDQEDAWWDAHTVPGNCPFEAELEPYRLLGTPSPLLLLDDDFLLWFHSVRSLS